MKVEVTWQQIVSAMAPFDAQVKDIKWVMEGIISLEKGLEKEISLNRYAAGVAGVSGVALDTNEQAIIRGLKIFHASIGREYLTPMEKLRRTLDELRARK